MRGMSQGPDEERTDPPTEELDLSGLDEDEAPSASTSARSSGSAEPASPPSLPGARGRHGRTIPAASRPDAGAEPLSSDTPSSDPLSREPGPSSAGVVARFESKLQREHKVTIPIRASPPAPTTGRPRPTLADGATVPPAAMTSEVAQAAHHARLSNLELELRELKRQLEGVAESGVDSSRKLRARIDTLEANPVASLEMVEQRDERVSSLEERVVELVEELEGFREGLEATREQPAEVGLRLAGLASRIDALETAGHKTSESLSETELSLATLRAATRAGAADALSHRMSTLERRLDVLEERLGPELDASRAAATRVEQMGAKLDRITTDVIGFGATLEMLARRMDTWTGALGAQIDAVEAKVEGIRTPSIAPPNPITRVPGIGPKHGAALAAANVFSPEDLADLEDEELEGLTERLGLTLGRTSRWREAARSLLTADEESREIELPPEEELE